MAKYFINGEEFANLATARKAAKELSKTSDGDVIINNEDTTIKAVYNGGKEVGNAQIETADTVNNSNVYVENVDDTYGIQRPVPTEDVSEDTRECKIRLYNKIRNEYSILISGRHKDGKYASEKEANEDAERFLNTDALKNIFDYEIIYC